MLQVELVSKWFFLFSLAEVATIKLAIVLCLKKRGMQLEEDPQ